MTTLSQALELVREKFGTVRAEWYDALEKTTHSKNITISDWNFLVEKLAVVSADMDGFFKLFEAIAEFDILDCPIVPNMDVLDEMMFEKYGNDERPNPDYYFSKINWNLLQKFNRAYIQVYDDAGEYSLSFGGDEDGTGVYALKAISRYGGARYVDDDGSIYDTMVPRHPWMSKRKWEEIYFTRNPESSLTPDELHKSYKPNWTDYEPLGTLVERRPDGHIRIPKGFSYADGDTTQLATSKHYVDTSISDAKAYAKQYVDDAVPDVVADAVAGAVGDIDKRLESKLTRRTIASTDGNRYVYTQMYKQTNDGIELMLIGQKTASANSIVRRTADGTVVTATPKSDSDAATKKYVDTAMNSSPSFKYTLSSNGKYYIITGRGTVTGSELTFPDTYQGKPVMQIATDAFKNDSSITKVTFGKYMMFISTGNIETWTNCKDLRFTAKLNEDFANKYEMYCGEKPYEGTWVGYTPFAEAQIIYSIGTARSDGTYDDSNSDYGTNVYEDWVYFYELGLSNDYVYDGLSIVCSA